MGIWIWLNMLFCSCMMGKSSFINILTEETMVWENSCISNFEDQLEQLNIENSLFQFSVRLGQQNSFNDIFLCHTKLFATIYIWMIDKLRHLLETPGKWIGQFCIQRHKKLKFLCLLIVSAWLLLIKMILSYQRFSNGLENEVEKLQAQNISKVRIKSG